MVDIERRLPGEVLIKQGAEALAYKSYLLSPSHTCLRKHRPPKPYRHPILDARLTQHRIMAESRLLHKLRRAGVSVPAVMFIDPARGDLWMEFIHGTSLHDFLINHTSNTDAGILEVMTLVGKEIAAMHDAECVHGDLTTSNLLWTDDERVVVIDLGLGTVSISYEDQAVDLYVLERAFLATHPSSEPLFAAILQSYAKHKKQSATVLKKLDNVRLRGRKRTMVG